MNQELEKDFDRVYSLYSKMLFGIIYSYLKTRVDAEDILQDVFITYLEKHPKFDNDNELKYWLIRIAINKSINEIKKKNHIVSKELDSFYDIPSENNQDNEIKDEVLKLVYSLPLKFKTVIVLYYFEEMKIKEISKALKTNESTIKMRLKKAKEILKEKWEI